MTSCPLVMLWLHYFLNIFDRFAITSCELVLTKFDRICDVYYYCGVVLSSCIRVLCHVVWFCHYVMWLHCYVVRFFC